MRTFTLAELCRHLKIGNPTAYLKNARVNEILSNTQLFYNGSLVEYRIEDGFIFFYGLTIDGNFERLRDYTNVIENLTFDQETFALLLKSYSKGARYEGNTIIIEDISDVPDDVIIKDANGNRLYTETQFKKGILKVTGFMLAAFTAVAFGKFMDSKKK